MDEDLIDSDAVQYDDDLTNLLGKDANQWYWDNGGSGMWIAIWLTTVWTQYDVFQNAEIQNAYADKKKEYHFTIADTGSYVIIFAKMLQVNTLTGVARRVKCDNSDNRDNIVLKLASNDDVDDDSDHLYTARKTVKPPPTSIKSALKTLVVSPPSPRTTDTTPRSNSASNFLSSVLAPLRPLTRSTPVKREGESTTISGVNQWYWDNDGTWEAFDSLTNIAIQNAYADKKKVVFVNTTHRQLQT